MLHSKNKNNIFISSSYAQNIVRMFPQSKESYVQFSPATQYTQRAHVVTPTFG